MILESEIDELLRVKSNGFLYHREGQELEFKEQFNFAGLADYFRDFSAFSNNRGGYLIFGVKDSPRILVGLSEKAQDFLLELIQKKSQDTSLIYLFLTFIGNRLSSLETSERSTQQWRI